MQLYLSLEQANSIYSAMAELNKVGLRIAVRGLKQGAFDVNVHEDIHGAIIIASWDGVIERYPNQNAFGVAYGIDF